MPIKLINPMNETPVRVSTPPARLRSLHGKTIGLLDHQQDRRQPLPRSTGAPAPRAISRSKRCAHGETDVCEAGPPGIIEQLRGVDAVVEALAD